MDCVKVDTITNGYSPAAPKHKKRCLDRVTEYCKKEGINYSEYQRREFFDLLPEKVLNDGLPKTKVYINQKAYEVCHGAYRQRKPRKAEK